MSDDALAFDIVQDLAYFSWRPLAMIQKRDEVRDRPFKIDIVFPKRIVRIDEKGLRITRVHEAYRGMAVQLTIPRTQFAAQPK